MKMLTLAAALLLLCVAFPAPLFAGTVDKEGKAWLDSQKDAPTFNVNGSWGSEEWGDFRLIQTEGSREVSGNGGGYQITGVVSGNHLFMLFSTRGTVDYCATLSPNGENSLIGNYSDRKSRFKSGLCQESSRPMNMKKK